MTEQYFRRENFMNKEDLIRTNAVNIANQICNRIKTNNDNSDKPFVTGWSDWEDITKHRTELAENIVELHKHPRKNKVLIEYLNAFAESEMI